MPAARKVVPGEPFGRYSVIREVSRGDDGRRRIMCRCDCGKVKVVPLQRLVSGNTSSCGCLRSEMVSAKNLVHGMKNRKEYVHWKAMRQRCNNPNHHKYPEYGGKGITICQMWDSFELFLRDMGPIPSDKHSLDRFPDRNGNYEPSNVRWATDLEQSANKDGTLRFWYQGRSLTLHELSTISGIPHHRLYVRIVLQGWSVDRAASLKPKLGRNQHG